MFETLKPINEQVFNSTKTIETNIRAASNSFYYNLLNVELKTFL